MALGAILGGLFQSHAGSIEALDRVLDPVPAAPFQSHAGSIEACQVRIWCRLGKLCFNPTLVRLRLCFSDFDEFVERKFQSHAGSIEAGRVGKIQRGR